MPRFTTSDGLSLYYEDQGAGRPVLCLAGLTRNARDFDFVAPHLGDLRLLRLDYRGRGQSDHDPEFMNYSILREAQDVIELLDHLGLDRVTILGTSRGGLIAMALAAGHGDRLQGVVLNDIGPEVTPNGLERIMDYVGKPPNAPTLDEAAQALKAVSEAQFPGVPLTRWRAQAGAMFEEQPGGGLALRYDPKLRDALIGQAGVGEAPDLWLLFDALKEVPLAVIRGANSDLLSAETVERMAERHPGLICATVPDRGHVPFLDEPEALKAIRDLLEVSQ
ncbi:Pimeloyl-ACP methyl ester carboxylesterase [Roseovarius pacificus]|uniref:Pimeloyl-ACP methyl ester carboxylesterase n=1 Tax=Roseovarius pacificus TaxID=337701 RepID=A0A1M7JBP4_9RHOB|nr:alpha/beta hydrolase [Roseovarius pacificus]GGO62013.1 hydrolase [Roseovarius pacificus]SHM49917.1 Pimeloyl-ACP methyl ester carboxylesterase [Roseovarius pacificus]